MMCSLCIYSWNNYNKIILVKLTISFLQWECWKFQLIIHKQTKYWGWTVCSPSMGDLTAYIYSSGGNAVLSSGQPSHYCQLIVTDSALESISSDISFKQTDRLTNWLSNGWTNLTNHNILFLSQNELEPEGPERPVVFSLIVKSTVMSFLPWLVLPHPHSTYPPTHTHT